MSTTARKKTSNIKIVEEKEEKEEIEEIVQKNEPDITSKLVEQRCERQEYNNKIAYDAIKLNSKNPNEDNVNEKALKRLLTFTKYNHLNEIINDKDNLVENIIKISALYIAKNASRQGAKDEALQLESINIFQDHGITIIKDGKQKPIKGGGIRKSGKKQSDELKTIDFVVKLNNIELGYITAKITSGEGGHQDNVLDEITQFCEWTTVQQQIDPSPKIYIVLYDNNNTSAMINDIKKKYKSVNLIITNCKNFKDDFLNWFNTIYKKV
jgi:hypothetical protein